VNAVARALIVTLLLEVPLVVLCYPGQRRRIAVVAIAANTLTNLTLNLVFPQLRFLRGHFLLAGEIFAVLGEAAAYTAAGRPPSAGRALAVSGAGNLLSYRFGGALAVAVFSPGS
jgi:hypothetical protein